MDITLFITGEIELTQVKKLPCASGQFFGRPNWGRIFKQNRDKHRGEHIGVFLCGSPIIGEALSRESVKNSDLVGTPGATRFSFFKDSVRRSSHIMLIRVQIVYIMYIYII